jgi:hypothetical protein
LDESGKSCRESFTDCVLWTPLDFRFRHFRLSGLKALAQEKSRQKAVGRAILTDRLLVSEFFGIIQDIDHTAAEAKTMKNGLLTIGTILALKCVGQAKDMAPAQNSEQTQSVPNPGTIIVYRQWSFSGAGRPSWKFNVR